MTSMSYKHHLSMQCHIPVNHLLRARKVSDVAQTIAVCPSIHRPISTRACHLSCLLAALLACLD